MKSNAARSIMPLGLRPAKIEGTMSMPAPSKMSRMFMASMHSSP